MTRKSSGRVSVKGVKTARRKLSGRVKPLPHEHDAQLEEFEAKDLGDDLAAVKPVIFRPSGKGHVRSISLDDDLVDRLKRVGAKRGLGYQTMLKVIVREHVEDYE